MKKLFTPLLIIAIGSFAIGSFFDIKLTIARRPLLARVFPKLVKPTPTPADYASQVLPADGVTLPVKWGDLGTQLVKLGVIDEKKFVPIADSGNIKITSQNSREVLNSLWAFGLANQNSILDAGPMVDKQYGGAENFASTGGWTISVGDAMSHYSKHSLVPLTPDQQQLVESVSKNIYRPCCGNSTYFPDCNHGMAMLGLLELMAAQGIGEENMYKYALAINSYWFPDTYMTIAKYKAGQGVPWTKVDPQEILSANFSSLEGYKKILSQVEPVQNQGGGGCGV